MIKKVIKILAALFLGILLGGYFFLGNAERSKLFSRFVSKINIAGLLKKEPDSRPLVNQSSKIPPISIIAPVKNITSESIIEKKEALSQREVDPLFAESSNSSILGITQGVTPLTTSRNGTATKKLESEAIKTPNSSQSKVSTTSNAVSGVNTKEKILSNNEIFSSEPVIIFNSANKKVGHNGLRGEIYAKEGTSVPLVQQDGVIPLSFIDDFAMFLVTNYWPKGTHPSAQNKDFSTVTLGWINSHYSNFFVNKNTSNTPPREIREKIFSYVCKPVMVNALSSLYQERFIASLVNAGFTRFGQNTQGAQQVAEMLSFYSLRAHSVASALKGYLHSPEAHQKSDAFLKAERDVQEAYRKYNDVRFSNQNKESLEFRSAVKKYQSAILLRDQAKMRVASVMRRSGDTRYLSEDDLSFIALWLTRREKEYYDGLSSFAGALNSLSALIESKAQYIKLRRDL